MPDTSPPNFNDFLDPEALEHLYSVASWRIRSKQTWLYSSWLSAGLSPTALKRKRG